MAGETQDYSKLKNANPFLVTNSVKIRKAIANVRTGTSDAKILCIGDSTTAGVGISGSIQGMPNAYPYQLANILNACGIPSAPGLAIPGHPGNLDNRFTLGTGWNNFTIGWGANGDYQWSGGTVGNLVYTDTNVLADRYDIYYAQNTTLGTVGITATGGTTVNQSTVGTAGTVGKVTVSAASASTSNTVTFVPANNGSIHILGIEPWLSTAKKVRVGNAGVGSSRAFTNWDIGGNWSSPTCIKAYAPDLTIISLGINDAGDNQTIDNVKTAIVDLATAAQVSGDVLIMSPIPCTSGASASVIANLPLISAGQQSMNYPFTNLRSRWIDGDTANTNGFMSDTLHPNALGYADIAQMLKNIIIGL